MSYGIILERASRVRRDWQGARETDILLQIYVMSQQKVSRVWQR